MLHIIGPIIILAVTATILILHIRYERNLMKQRLKAIKNGKPTQEQI